ncbi:MAG: hypothetical protein AAF614_29780 [Chloroflexota bacterium]
MVTSRWQKQNTSIFSIAFLILFVTIGFIGFPTRLFNLEGRMALIVSAIIAILGIGLAFLLVKWRPNAMVRILRFNHQTVEQNFRDLFANNSIEFQLKKNDGTYCYEFPRQSLKMSTQPYALHNFEFDHKRTKQPATKVMLENLRADNQDFARRLADLIDNMAKQRPNQWDMG